MVGTELITCGLVLTKNIYIIDVIQPTTFSPFWLSHASFLITPWLSLSTRPHFLVIYRWQFHRSINLDHLSNFRGIILREKGIGVNRESVSAINFLSLFVHFSLSTIFIMHYRGSKLVSLLFKAQTSIYT